MEDFLVTVLPRSVDTVGHSSAVSASERGRENAQYERYCFIQVTCNMNAKDQTWNENI